MSTDYLDRMAATADATQQFGMTPVGPVQDPTGGAGYGDGSPVLQQLPGALKAIDNKYSNPEFLQSFQQLPPAVQQLTQQLDMARARKGQMPVSAESSLKAGQAAMTHEAVTPAQEISASPTAIPTNATSDLKILVKALPHIPKGLFNEVIDTFDGLDDDVQQARDEGKNAVQQFLNLPVIRMIPGAYTASNIAGGDIAEIVRHPLFTALDVLPYANKAAKMQPVFKAAEEEVAALNKAGLAVNKPRPITTALLRKIDTSPEAQLLAEPRVIPNRAGEFVNDNIKTLAPVAKLSDLMGGQARQVSRIIEGGNQQLKDWTSGTVRVNAPTQALEDVAELTRYQTKLGADDKLLMEDFGLTRAREAELKLIGTQGAVSERASFLPNEQAYVAQWEAANDTMRTHLVKEGLLGEYKGEVFTTDQTKNFVSKQTGINDAKALILGGVTSKGADKIGMMHKFDLLRQDTRFEAAYQDVVAGDFRSAASRLNRKQNYPMPKITGVTDRQIGKIIDGVEKVAAREKRLFTLERKTPPARFADLINDKAAANYVNQLETRGVLGDRGQAEAWLHEGQVDRIPGWDKTEFMKHQDGIRKTWQQLQAAGEDPIYLPRVTISQAKQVGHGGISDRIPTIRATKERMGDISPSVDSPSIALSHEGFNIMARHISTEITSEIGMKFGIPEEQLRAMFAEHAVVKSAGVDSIRALAKQEQLMKQWGMPYNPETMGVFGGGVMGSSASKDAIWLPRSIGKTLEAFNKESASSIKRLVDPVTGLMRVSLLPLSPRWHLYNIIGGAMMLMSEAGPGAFRPANIAKTRLLLNAAKTGAHIAPEVADEVTRLLGYTSRDEMRLAFEMGGVKQRLFTESWVGRNAKKGIKASFDFNQHFDDMYRVMGYLYGQDKALVKGLSRGEAQAEGVAIARKVLQDSAAMTPFERNVLRSVFPFYSWLSHVMRFTMQYPLDHPWRAALVAGFGRQVFEDLGEGGTVDMLNNIEYGGVDKDGNRKSLRVGPMNPFNDAGNLFTLAGWAGALNPLGSTVLQQLGYDSQQGGPELFPQMSYDPTTGRLKSTAGNPLQNLLFNTIPQSQVLFRASGLDQDFNKMRADPESQGAARAMLLSGMGLPSLNKASNSDKKYYQAETQRQKARTMRIAELIKKGDIDGLVGEGVSPENIRAIVQQQQSGEYNPAMLDPVEGQAAG